MLQHAMDRLLGKTTGRKRSPEWRKFRNEFIKKNPRCRSCGGTKKLEAHHIISFSDDPSRELDESNLIVLCRRKKYGIHCHLLVGHCGNYRQTNPNVEQMALRMYVYLYLRKKLAEGKK